MLYNKDREEDREVVSRIFLVLVLLFASVKLCIVFHIREILLLFNVKGLVPFMVYCPLLKNYKFLLLYTLYCIVCITFIV